MFQAVVQFLGGLLPTIVDAETTTKIAGVIFTVVFGSFIVVGTTSVDAVNRIIFCN